VPQSAGGLHSGTSVARVGGLRRHRSSLSGRRTVVRTGELLTRPPRASSRRRRADADVCISNTMHKEPMHSPWLTIDNPLLAPGDRHQRRCDHPRRVEHGADCWARCFHHGSRTSHRDRLASHGLPVLGHPRTIEARCTANHLRRAVLGCSGAESRAGHARRHRRAWSSAGAEGVVLGYTEIELADLCSGQLSSGLPDYPSTSKPPSTASLHAPAQA